MKSKLSSLSVHKWPLLFGLGFTVLAIHWAFILDPPGRVLNRDSLLGLLFAWMILFFISIIQKRWVSILAWIAAPLSYVLVLSICRAFVSPQIEEAKVRGEALMERAELYLQAQGEYPVSLDALSVFDGQAIPTTGIGIFGRAEKTFYIGSPSNYAFDDYVGEQFFYESPYRTEFWIGFREYGFQEHKLRSGSEWDTDSGEGDYLIGRIDLDS